MCGIVGYVGRGRALPVLLEGLRRLEYRGYDSAGIVVAGGDALASIKTVGKVSELERRINGTPLEGSAGLGHTRWATHGGVTSANAHPHFSCDGRIAVVHNGIIENHAELRHAMSRHRFLSSTDTETIPHVIEECLAKAGNDPLRAVHLALSRLRGSFALGVIFADHPRLLIAARVNCPLVIGLGEEEFFMASDIPAVLGRSRTVLPLEEHEIAAVSPEGVRVFDRDLAPRSRAPIEITWTQEAVGRGDHAHYMEKEIHEQSRIFPAEVEHGIAAAGALALPAAIDRVLLAACGTSWHAALVGKTAIEEHARIPAEAVLASEFRYGFTPVDARTLVIAVSQSGETADTLAALRRAHEAGAPVLAVTNARGSTLAREADQAIYMSCGTEIGVAATKTYTSQVLQLIFLALALGRRRGTLPESAWAALTAEARSLGGRAAEILRRAEPLAGFARKNARERSYMFIGRGYNLPTALEGALKMKEISYLHAEGYGAGEMKHGPLALVDDRMICVAVAPRGPVLDKMLSNVQEVRARGGSILGVVTEGSEEAASLCEHVVTLPPCSELFTPVLAVLPLQLLAYYTAVELGRDVDRPRNLAKSVTVE
jgi:glucosamine--fructose-6-phosphate aminotransferase (isomerizing)